MNTTCAGGKPDEGRDAPDVRVVYGLVAAVSVAYAIWGSLFPFNIEPVSLTTAIGLLWDARLAAAWSISDLVSNVLLFVPIGASLFALAEKVVRRPRRRPLIPVGVFGAAVLLSVAIELGQAFVPWRTPSILDVSAEAAGTVVGLGIWRAARSELAALARTAADVGRRAGWAERALFVYAALFAALWLLPFDVTLRPAEIRDKFAHKRLLLPLMASPDAATAVAHGITLISAMPLGLGAALCACQARLRRSIAVAWLTAALALLALGVAQVFVFSRTTDGALLVSAVAGAGIGAAASRVLPVPERQVG
jgi:glycopeptide antibiotics resistance protein